MKSYRKTISLSLFPLIFLTAILSGCFNASQNATFSKDTSATAASVVPKQEENPESFEEKEFSTDFPQYSGEAFAPVNNNVPLFTEDDINSVNDILFSELDDLGRCGPAIGLIGPETIPEMEREPIGDVKPSGWHTIRYDDRIEDRYLYNRCHLIGYQLSGANAEPRNLITGTRYLNINGMLPFESTILSYIMLTGKHVLYRVTPVFEDDNLIASGVLLEAYSVEDEGSGIQFCEYVFNVQPGVIIDYKTGDSYEDETYIIIPEEPEIIPLLPNTSETDSAVPDRAIPIEENEDPAEITYVLNTNTMRFHDPSCPSVEDMKEKNKAFTTDTREELIEKGYIPCGRCNP